MGQSNIMTRDRWREAPATAPVPESMLSKREQLRNEYICTRVMLAHRYPAWQVPNTSRGRRPRCKLGFMLTLQRIKFHDPALRAVANFSPPLQYSRRQVNAEYISVNNDSPSPLPLRHPPPWPTAGDWIDRSKDETGSREIFRPVTHMCKLMICKRYVLQKILTQYRWRAARLFNVEWNNSFNLSSISLTYGES